MPGALDARVGDDAAVHGPTGKVRDQGIERLHGTMIAADRTEPRPARLGLTARKNAAEDIPKTWRGFDHMLLGQFDEAG